jgi:maleamate amidohydrolase
VGEGVSENQDFSKKGYDADSRMGFGTRPAVVVVDFQKAFTDPRFPLAGSAHVHKAVEATAVLLKAARAAGAPIAHSYTAHSHERDAPHWKVRVVAEQFRHGWEGCELDPRTYDPAYDTVYAKAAPSIFFGTSCAQFFAKEQVDTVFVTGCTTSGCVRASIVDAFSYGFRVMVPEPCSGDQGEDAHKANLVDVARRYADVLTLEESLAYFETIRAQRPDG